MFERFTHEAGEVLVDAKNHCAGMHDDRIRAEHLLLAVVTIRNVSTDAAFDEAGLDRAGLYGVVASLAAPEADALGALGIDYDAVRRQAEAAFGPGALHRPHQVRLERPRHANTPRRMREVGAHLGHNEAATAALQRAPREADALGHEHAGSEHLLLALLADDTAPAAAALRRVGTDPAQVRAGVLQRLKRAA